MLNVILCDTNGIPTGSASVCDAHKSPGNLHLAFSVFVFQKNRGELLIQKRSRQKKLFGNLWTNTCCSHVKPLRGHVTQPSHQDIAQVGMKRLKEELGFTCPLKEVESFTYRAEDPHGNGIEHEYDTVLVGNVESAVHVVANPKEIDEWKWIPVQELQEDLKNHPEKYTPWFAQALDIALQ